MLFQLIVFNQFSLVLHILEYCNLDYYEPSCNNEDIIIMQKAQYGRMKIGRCVKHDLGYIGCATNVLDFFDEQCSGKSRCRVYVSPADIVTSQGCSDALVKYLEASHICVPCMLFRYSLFTYG